MDKLTLREAWHLVKVEQTKGEALGLIAILADREQIDQETEEGLQDKVAEIFGFMTYKEKKEIAENYINGNLSDVKDKLFCNDSRISVGRSFEVYQCIRREYGQTLATGFSNWLQTYAD